MLGPGPLASHTTRHIALCLGSGPCAAPSYLQSLVAAGLCHVSKLCAWSSALVCTAHLPGCHLSSGPSHVLKQQGVCHISLASQGVHWIACSFDGTLGYPGEGHDLRYDVKVCTANPNTFSTFLSAVQASTLDDAHVVFVQETKLTSSDLPGARTSLGKKGFAACFAPCIESGPL